MTESKQDITPSINDKCSSGHVESEWLLENKKYLAQLSQHQVNCIVQYTSYMNHPDEKIEKRLRQIGYDTLNGWLRAGQPTEYENKPKDEIDYMRNWLKCLQNVLTSAPQLKNATLFRGVTTNYNIFSELKIGAVWSATSFLSTTLDFEIARDYSGDTCCVIELGLLSTGAIFVGELKNRREAIFGIESEVLLPYGIKFIYQGTYSCPETMKLIHSFVQQVAE